MKDVETIRPAELVIAAMLPRADVRDRLVGADSIGALARGARVGTSSPRRTAQLLALRSDLIILPFRGNVATRLARIERGEADATLLASAGLDRLGLGAIGTPMATDTLLPAPAQGAIGVEARSGDEAVLALVAAIDHAATHACVGAERRLLEGLGGDCRSAVAALAILEDGAIRLRAEILTADGRERQAGDAVFPAGDTAGPAELAARLLGAASPGLRALFGK
jgi:hydroxymethylbilane synthase